MRPVRGHCVGSRLGEFVSRICGLKPSRAASSLPLAHCRQVLTARGKQLSLVVLLVSGALMRIRRGPKSNARCRRRSCSILLRSCLRRRVRFGPPGIVYNAFGVMHGCAFGAPLLQQLATKYHATVRRPRPAFPVRVLGAQTGA